MSWNGNDNKNPWGNNDGPPDIDEEIKKLRERFNKVFGGGTWGCKQRSVATTARSSKS